MPIQNPTTYNQTNYGVTYEIAPNMTHKLTYSEFAIRQVCHLWGIGSIGLTLAPLGYGIKAAADLAGHLIPEMAPRKNVLGHQLPFIGRPLNWMWQNPSKASFITLLAYAPNLVAHLVGCLGEHVYTARTLSYAYKKEMGQKFDYSILIPEKIYRQVLDEHPHFITKNFFDQGRKPRHFFVHLNETLFNVLKDRFYSDPDFLSLMQEPSSDTKKLRTLIIKHISRANAAPPSSHTEL